MKVLHVILALSVAPMFADEPSIIVGDMPANIEFSEQVGHDMRAAIVTDITNSLAFMVPMTNWLQNVEGESYALHDSRDVAPNPSPIPSCFSEGLSVSLESGIASLLVADELVDCYVNPTMPGENIRSNVVALISSINSGSITNLPLAGQRNIFFTSAGTLPSDEIIRISTCNLASHRLYPPSTLTFIPNFRIYDGTVEWAVNVPAFEKSSGKYESMVTLVSTNGIVQVYAP